MKVKVLILMVVVNGSQAFGMFEAMQVIRHRPEDFFSGPLVFCGCCIS